MESMGRQISVGDLVTYRNNRWNPPTKPRYGIVTKIIECYDEDIDDVCLKVLFPSGVKEEWSLIFEKVSSLCP